jgi:hypothetical protein
VQQHRPRPVAHPAVAVQPLDRRDVERRARDRLAAGQHPRLADHDRLDLAVEIVAAQKLGYQLGPDPGRVAQQQADAGKAGHCDVSLAH